MRLTTYVQTYQGNANWFPNVLYGFMISMSAYLASYRNLDVSTDYLEELPNFRVTDEFDFIVVGGGSAGAVVANRLSQNYTVLLLEAGGEPHPLHLFPAFSTTLLNYREVDWRHKSVPQKNSTYAQPHRESLLSQGKALGGTSNINFMMHSRGNPRDFDTWSELVGDDQWNYDNLLPFFKKYENYNLKEPSQFTEHSWNSSVHGTGGDLNIEVPSYTGMADYFLTATEEMGYPRTDLNGRYKEGFDYTYTPIKRGRRQSTFTAFLEPIRGRRNLTIRKFAYVTKVLIGNETEAYGVAYEHHRIPRVAIARKEVILSAGALMSPKILLLSGIGPKDDLQDLGIPVLQDLPVGRNLQDHASTYLGPFFVNESITFLADRDLTSRHLPEFLASGTGPLSNPQASAFGFISSEIAKSNGEGDWPDVQIILSGSSICKECDRFLAHGFHLDEEKLVKYYANAKGRDSFMQLVSNARPKARGELRLRNSDPRAAALIDPKYLDNEHDVKVTVAGVKKAVEIAENTKTFQSLGGQFTDVSFPGCEDVAFRSDEYWECYIRQYTVSLHHIVGTCSMGKSPETGGVVDTELRVFGIRGLRVVDASVMPKVPVGNTNAPTIMIGEKGADLILKYWNGDGNELKFFNRVTPKNTNL